jgi:predicted nucleic acid-binding protein
MIILDTNVLSALMLEKPDRKVVAWLDRQPRLSIWISSVTVFEIHFGLRVLSGGKRRVHLMHAFDALLGAIDERVVPFDAAAAQLAAELEASRRKKGHPRELRDTMIAGIALARHATLATRNTKHFDDSLVPLVNPWTA